MASLEEKDPVLWDRTEKPLHKNFQTKLQVSVLKPWLCQRWSLGSSFCSQLTTKMSFENIQHDGEVICNLYTQSCQTGSQKTQGWKWILVTFPIAEIKYPDLSNLKEKGFGWLTVWGVDQRSQGNRSFCIPSHQETEMTHAAALSPFRQSGFSGKEWYHLHSVGLPTSINAIRIISCRHPLRPIF